MCKSFTYFVEFWPCFLKVKIEALSCICESIEVTRLIIYFNVSSLNFTKRGEWTIPDDEALGKSGTSGNFLMGRPALFPFGGMEIDEFDGNEDVGGRKRTM